MKERYTIEIGVLNENPYQGGFLICDSLTKHFIAQCLFHKEVRVKEQQEKELKELVNNANIGYLNGIKVK